MSYGSPYGTGTGAIGNVIVGQPSNTITTSVVTNPIPLDPTTQDDIDRSISSFSQGQSSFKPTQGQGTSSSSSMLSSPLARQLTISVGTPVNSGGGNVITGTPITQTGYNSGLQQGYSSGAMTYGGSGYNPYMSSQPAIGLGYGSGYSPIGGGYGGSVGSSYGNSAIGSGYGMLGGGYGGYPGGGGYGYRSAASARNGPTSSPVNSGASYRPPYGAISSSPARQSNSHSAGRSSAQSYPSSTYSKSQSSSYGSKY
jgi:hypothetical protein